jgi:hypothetical protein
MTLPLEAIHVPSPCEESWDAMAPRAGGRHCERCNYTVHDLSQKTEREISALLSSGERVCVRYVPTRFGTIRTAHDPVIPTSRLLAKARPALLAASAMLATACGPAVDALPSGVTNAMPGSLYSALRHPIDFVTNAFEPHCDVFGPGATAGEPMMPPTPTTPPAAPGAEHP